MDFQYKMVIISNIHPTKGHSVQIEYRQTTTIHCAKSILKEIINLIF
jgi:hypothetical protein